MMRRVPGKGPKPAKIMIVGEAPGANEELRGEPFVGQSGDELTRMLAEAGINRDECYVTNVCKFRPPNNELWRFFHSNDETKKLKPQAVNGLFPRQEVIDGLNELQIEIELVQPNIIIAVGNYSFWALSNNVNIKNEEGFKVPVGVGTWRGSIIPPNETYHGRKIIPIYHPAAILRMWEWRKITVHDLNRARRDSESPIYETPPYRFIVRPSYTDTIKWLNGLIADANAGPLKLAIDIETRLGHIACIGIAWSDFDAICIPFITKDSLQGYFTPYEEAAIIWFLYRLFTHPNVQAIGQNFAYDMQYIARRWGFIFHLHADTMLTQHVLFPGMPKTLDYIASLWCKFYCYWKDEGKEWDPRTMDMERHWVYNCKDAVNTFEVNREQQKIIELWKLQEQQQLLMDMFPVFLRTMLRGVRINLDLRKQLSIQLLNEIMECERWFGSVTKGLNLTKPKAKPWFSSPQQLAYVLYDLMKLPKARHRTTGKDTTNDEALTTIAAREPLIAPLINKLKEFRSLRIFHSNFIMASLDKDNRIRCSYNIGGTETFRLSSKEDAFGMGTNLQNIPKGNEDD